MEGESQPTNQPTNGPSLIEAYRILSARECSVLTKLGQGKSNRQIAAELYLSEGTVKTILPELVKSLV